VRSAIRLFRPPFLLNAHVVATERTSLERGQRAKVGPTKQYKSDRPMKPSAKFVTAAFLLIGCASTASAQSCWYYGECSLKLRGYYGTPYGGGPQYGSAAETSTDTVPPTVTGNKHRLGQSAPPLYLATGLERALLGSLLRVNTKRFAPTYSSGRSTLWLKVKNPKALAVKREAEEDWAI
jgi:hypothetical protein